MEPIPDNLRGALPGVRLAFQVPLRAEGTLKISRELNWIGKLVTKLAPLPPSGNSVHTELRVNLVPGGAEWRRSFGDFTAVSVTYRVRGRLREKTGPFEFEFEESVKNGAVIHNGRCSKAFGIPLLPFMGPNIGGTVEPADDDQSWKVFVIARHWLLGVIIRYEGTMRAL